MTAAGPKSEKRGSIAGARQRPVLDPGLVPAIAWCSTYRADAASEPGSAPIAIAVERPDGGASCWEGVMLPHEGAFVERNPDANAATFALAHLRRTERDFLEHIARFDGGRSV